MSLPFPAAVIQSAMAAGVREFVVCAGARNSALVVVLAAAGDRVRLWQHFDERAAAFFAIGRIRATERPVAVVTTSGTAVAELLPAVVEAHYQGLPLIALTADRPRNCRGSGAPQAIEQEYILGRFVSTFVDVEDEPVDLTGWNRSSPLHLNACLTEPDSATLPSLRAAADLLKLADAQSCQATFPSVSAPLCARRLVMAGELLDSEIAAAKEIVRASGGLIDAEAASGLREQAELEPQLLRCGEATLRHLPVQHVLRVGGVPSARYWRDLESHPEIAVTHHSRSGYPGLARKENVSAMQDGDSIPVDTPLSIDDFTSLDATLAKHLDALLAAHPNSEPGLIRSLSERIPQQATVLTGNSLAVREWNLCAAWGRGHRVHVLRGANGIDGNLSAFLGLAADRQESWCLAGDLTALYDLSAPWMLSQLSAGRRRFVIVQNGGGKIFSRLPSLRGLNDHERSLMENPHRISLKPWAEMWGMDHVSGSAELLTDHAALGSLGDHAVIELHPDPVETERFWKEWREAEQEVWA